ncbi:hypothetical protein ACWGIU_36560, partial [Streptomyces sp. NPDC054840]
MSTCRCEGVLALSAAANSSRPVQPTVPAAAPPWRNPPRSYRGGLQQGGHGLPVGGDQRVGVERRPRLLVDQVPGPVGLRGTPGRARHHTARLRRRVAPGQLPPQVPCGPGGGRRLGPDLGALRDRANPFSILTKGTLILRGLPLLREAAAVTEVGISVSVGFTDTGLWRTVEPGTPSPTARLGAVWTLTDAGIECGVLMAPVIPFVGDSPEQLRVTVRAVAEAGATSVTPLVLHLRPGAREWFTAWLGAHHPHLVPRYERMYAGGSYAPTWYQRRITRQVHEL